MASTPAPSGASSHPQEPKSSPTHRGTVVASVAVVVVMVGLSYAAVPLYDLFCRVTGFGGTTQRAEMAPSTVLAQSMTIRFDASVNRSLPWRFSPPAEPVTLPIGESGLAFYHVENVSDSPIIGTATFNVSPPQAGYYFNKIACFCFTEQELAPGEQADLPVTFFVDPEIVNDPELKGVKTITLSYTFFQSPKSVQQSVSQPRG